VVGLFPGKAVVVINGQAPRTIRVGEKTAEGVTLLSTASNSATLNIDGKRIELEVGQLFAAPAKSRGAQSITLPADSGGHFLTVGQVNGKSVQFLVDTGASAISLSAGFAQGAGIDYRKGQRGFVQTANGVTAAYRVMLDSVRLGDITLYQVEGVVIEGAGMNVALLGMSFLNRMEMRRDGAMMTLTKRY
jgi:aspartyl protease family protein